MKIYLKITISLFLLFSLVLTAFFIGIENLAFNNVDWLLGGADTSNSQNAWTFFKNDKWYFPLAKNPNYGLEIGTSVIFTDSIPILALLFKLFKNFLGENFQYFSLWIFLCFFLQLLISFLILEKITKNFHFSFLSSVFFVLSPIFLYRLGMHLALGGQWIILFAYYINLCIEKEKAKIYWICLIVFSSCVHAYFTAMLFVIYSCNVLSEFIETKRIKKAIIDIFIPALILILFMYLLGYFDNSIINSVSIGYGIFGLDLFGIFDPSTETSQLNWSYFIDDIPGTSIEGFNYFGVGGLILIFTSIIFFLFNSAKDKNYFLYFFLRNKTYLLILFVFSFWAITTNIHYKGELLLSLPIHKYLFGVLSIFGATGRFFWPVYYLLIIFSLIYIFKKIKKKHSLLLLYFIIFLQLVDINPALKNFFIEKKHLSSFTQLKDPIWKSLPQEFKYLRTTYLYHNYGRIFSGLNHYIGTSGFKKTDIVLSAGLDRSKAASVRYELIHALSDRREISQDTAYIIDNLGHLKQMKYFLKDTNVGFFYRDNFWIALPNKKNDMSIEDQQRLKNIKFYKLKNNNNYKLNFSNREEFLGFGWSHNFGKKGVWSEGESAFILFDFQNKKNKNRKLSMRLKPYLNNNNKDFEMIIYFNDIEKKKVNFYSNKGESVISFDLDEQDILEQNVIKFKFKNLISPVDIFESPDGRKLGVLLKSLIIE